MTSKAPYTDFGKTYDVPVIVMHNDVFLENPTEWDETLWVERGEDWYALQSPQLKGLRVRIVSRDAWMKARQEADFNG